MHLLTVSTPFPQTFGKIEIVWISWPWSKIALNNQVSRECLKIFCTSHLTTAPFAKWIKLVGLLPRHAYNTNRVYNTRVPHVWPVVLLPGLGISSQKTFLVAVSSLSYLKTYLNFARKSSKCPPKKSHELLSRPSTTWSASDYQIQRASNDLEWHTNWTAEMSPEKITIYPLYEFHQTNTSIIKPLQYIQSPHRYWKTRATSSTCYHTQTTLPEQEQRVQHHQAKGCGSHPYDFYYKFPITMFYYN